MKIPSIIWLLPLLLVASCTCQTDWVHATDYEQMGGIDWGQEANGLQIGRAQIWSRTPLPWFDFSKLYLRNASDKPIQVFDLPDVLTEGSTIATTETEGSFRGFLIELAVHDKVSGRSYFAYVGPQSQARPIILQPGQQISVLPRLDISFPQQPSGNHYSSTWSYHVFPGSTTRSSFETAWSGDIQTDASECEVN